MIHGLAPRSTIHGLARHLPGQHDQASHGHGGGAASGKFRPDYPDEHDAMAAIYGVTQERAAVRDPSDQAAVGFYQSKNWGDVNEPLRAGLKNPGDDPDIGNIVTRMDRMMTSEGGLPANAYLYRGISDPSVLPAASLIGRRITDRGYVSTTTDRYLASSFATPGKAGSAIVIRINGRRGQPALLAGNNVQAEHEVILPRRTTFRVTFDAVDSQSGMRVIHAEIES